MKNFTQWLNGFVAIFSAAGVLTALCVLVLGDETADVEFLRGVIYWTAPVLGWSAMNWMVIANKRVRLSIEPQHPQEAATVADEAEAATVA